MRPVNACTDCAAAKTGQVRLMSAAAEPNRDAPQRRRPRRRQRPRPPRGRCPLQRPEPWCPRQQPRQLPPPPGVKAMTDKNRLLRRQSSAAHAGACPSHGRHRRDRLRTSAFSTATSCGLAFPLPAFFTALGAPTPTAAAAPAPAASAVPSPVPAPAATAAVAAPDPAATCACGGRRDVALC